MLSELLPKNCLICQRKLKAGQVNSILCPDCKPKITDVNLPRCLRCFQTNVRSRGTYCLACMDESQSNVIKQIRYLWEYKTNARDLIRSLKYTPSIKLAKYAGKLLAQEVCTLYPTKPWDLIIPIPTSRISFRKRLFNQTDYLARYLPGKKSYTTLTHNGYKVQQAKLSRTQREKNIKEVFSCKKDLSNKRILLVDDIITTGATISEAALALSAQNAKMVSVLCLAKRQ